MALLLAIYAAGVALIVATLGSHWSGPDRPARFHPVWSPALLVAAAGLWPVWFPLLAGCALVGHLVGL